MLAKFMAVESELTMTEIVTIMKQENSGESFTNMMKNICLQSPSKDIQKKGMEYLYMQGFHKELELLIEKNLESDNTSNRLWGSIYRIMLDQTSRKDHPRVTLQKIKQLTNRYSTNEPELLFLIELIKEKAYQILCQFDRIGNLMVTYQRYFSNIEERLLINYFKIRVYNINIIYHMVRNELIMARKYAYRTINMTDSLPILASIHTYLGLSYTFDTYEKGMLHLKKALAFSKEGNIHYLVDILENYNIPFLSAHFKMVDNITTSDIGEQAHLEIAKGNNDKAIQLLNELPNKNPFHLYYLGKAKEDRSILSEAYNHFIEKRSDYFFSRLPLNAIRTYDFFT
ncbi:AimR family lysis-lysogeny pheromone receptor [Oceanobacillus damuensis]|uniref:AimR family lysis-lysogeny pheromone receptor n=1 Tax=Oceanobacillus damuensis TaxID=937928 RepID=UPI0008298891|nr:AimR family lysis-lysogeny pheromone receptor [Oceanobacillus damuensis]